MSGRFGMGGISGKQFRLAEAGRDGGVFNATKLLYGELWRG